MSREIEAVHTHDYQYPVRKYEDSYRYRLTCPNKLLEEAGIEDGDELGVRVTLNEEDQLVVIYTVNLDEAHLNITAARHSSGEFTFPSALGAAMNVSTSNVTWSLKEYDDGLYELHAVTDFVPDKQNEMYYDLVAVKELRHVEQPVEMDEDEWEQEHFQLYMTVSEVEEVGWENGQKIGIRIVNVGGNIGVMLTPNITEINEKSIKEVKDTGENQRDLFLYVPNDIVKSLQFDTMELDWISEQGDLILMPAK